MKLIVGLGNPGDKYKFTRHNAGFMILDYLSQQWDFTFTMESKFKGEVAKINKDGETIILLKPHTYMNLSGEALISIMNFYKITTNDILIVHDDLDLQIGKMRFRAKGSDGGQRGIRSIIQVLGGNKDFARLKIGIGPQLNLSAEAYVLQNFTEEQLKELKPVIQNARIAIETYINSGITAAQSKFN